MNCISNGLDGTRGCVQYKKRMRIRRNLRLRIWKYKQFGPGRVHDQAACIANAKDRKSDPFGSIHGLHKTKVAHRSPCRFAVRTYCDIKWQVANGGIKSHCFPWHCQ